MPRAGELTDTKRMNQIKRVGVIGAGTMGNGIAQVFAQSGYEVHLIDAVAPALDRARGTIEKSLGKFVEKGKLKAEDRDAALGRLSTATDVQSLADELPDHAPRFVLLSYPLTLVCLPSRAPR